MVLGHLVLAGFQEGTLFFKATYIGPTWLISVPIKRVLSRPLALLAISLLLCPLVKYRGGKIFLLPF